jgi:hypothetical protein
VKRKHINKLGLQYAKACARYERTLIYMSSLDKGYITDLEDSLGKDKLFTASGSYGYLIADKEGHIVGWQDDDGNWCPECPEEYNMIRMFDMKCYLKHSKDRNADICELSDWDDDGDYTLYDKTIRKHVKSVQRGEGGFL